MRNIQRKKPVKRAFTGLVGMPHDEPVTAVPTAPPPEPPKPMVSPEPPKRGPGAPPKGEKATKKARERKS
jgi:hypothetical protein